jgi:hypothetical protein
VGWTTAGQQSCCNGIRFVPPYTNLPVSALSAASAQQRWHLAWPTTPTAAVPAPHRHQLQAMCSSSQRVGFAPLTDIPSLRLLHHLARLIAAAKHASTRAHTRQQVPPAKEANLCWRQLWQARLACAFQLVQPVSAPPVLLGLLRLLPCHLLLLRHQACQLLTLLPAQSGNESAGQAPRPAASQHAQQRVKLPLCSAFPAPRTAAGCCAMLPSHPRGEYCRPSAAAEHVHRAHIV